MPKGILAVPPTAAMLAYGIAVHAEASCSGLRMPTNPPAIIDETEVAPARAAPGAHRTAGASAALIGARLAGRGIDFITLLVLARLLTPADFGVVAIAMILVLIVEAVFELPVSQMLLVEPIVDRTLLDTAFTLSIVRGLVLALFLSVAAWPFAIFYHDGRLLPLISVLALSPAIRGIQNPGMLRFDRVLDFKRQIGCDIASKLVSCAVSSSLAYFTHSYWALACSTVLTPFLALIMSFALVPYRPRLTLAKWRLFSSFLGWLSAGQVFSALTWQVDRLMLGWAMSKPAVGRFTIADNLSALPTQVLLTPVIGPLSVSLSGVSDNDQRLRAAYLKLLSMVALVGFPALSGLALLAEPFARVALGSGWGDAGEILRWLSLATIPSLLWMPFNTLALAMKKSWLIFSRQLLDFIVKVPAAILLVLAYGIIGACIARGIATTIIGAASLLAARQLIAVRVRDQLQIVARPALGCGMMAAALYWPLSQLTKVTSMPALVAAMLALALAGAFIYILTVGTLWRLARSPAGGESLIHAIVMRLFHSLRRV